MSDDTHSDTRNGNGSDHAPRYEETVQLLSHSYGPELDPIVEDPAPLSQILQAADVTHSWEELQIRFPELGRQMQQDPDLRMAFELFVAIEQENIEQEEAEDTGKATPNAEPSSRPNLASRLRAAVGQGKHWITDALGNVALFAVPGSQFATGGAVLRSEGGDSQPLSQIGISDAEAIGGWDITVTVFAESEQTCRVEVSLFRDDLDAELAGIVVSLQQGDIRTSQGTDANGVAIFTGVPRAEIEEAILHIGLGDSQG